MTEKNLTVFYDGACPLCTREIAFYRRRRGAEGVQWIDVSQPGAEVENGEVAPGLSRQDALARFHVRDTDGQLISGGVAFARLWQAFPAFKPLGDLFRLRPFAWLLDRAYPLFLRFRPRIQRAFSTRKQLL